MKANHWPEYCGAFFLIGAGLVLLMHNAGLVPDLLSLMWVLLFLGSGAFFLLAFAADRSQWWTVIAGSGLTGVGASLLLNNVLRVSGELGGAALFLALGLGFLGVYLVRRRQRWWALLPAGVMVMLAAVTALSGSLGAVVAAVLFFGLGLTFVGLYFAEIDGHSHNWWALIPAGALLTLAVVVILSIYATGELAGAAFFAGLGLTFGTLYLLRGPGRPLEWAWIPAVALIGFGGMILLLTGSLPYARFFWPLALLASGVVLLVRYWREPRSRKERP